MPIDNAISIQDALCIPTLVELRALNSTTNPRRVDRGIYYLENNGMDRGIWVQYRADSVLDPSLSFVVVPNDGIGRWITSGRPEGSSVNTQTGTSYTLVSADQQRIIVFSNSLAKTLTVPTNSSVPIPVGSLVEIWNEGAGVLTVQAQSGVLLNGVSAGVVSVSTQYAAISLRKRATDSWLIAVGSSADVTS